LCEYEFIDNYITYLIYVK